MIDIKPKASNMSDAYFNRLKDLEKANSLNLPSSEDEVIKYLELWNRTYMHNGNTINIISFEQLIYFEIKYKNNKKIQNLIEILKEKIAYFYKFKMLLLDNLIDKDIYESINTKDLEPTNYAKQAGLIKTAGDAHD